MALQAFRRVQWLQDGARILAEAVDGSRPLLIHGMLAPAACEALLARVSQTGRDAAALALRPAAGTNLVSSQSTPRRQRAFACAELLGGARGVRRARTGEQRKGDAADGPRVGGRAVRLGAGDDFWGNVVGRPAQRPPLLRLVKSASRGRDAKVADLHGAVGAEQHVGELEIAVHDPAFVEVRHARANLPEHRLGRRLAEFALALQQLPQVAAAAVLEHEANVLAIVRLRVELGAGGAGGGANGLEVLVEPHDVRVPQRRVQRHLALQPCGEAGVREALLRDHFDCDAPPRRALQCAKNRSEAAATQEHADVEALHATPHSRRRRAARRTRLPT
mmetsp:Transcript_19375/g.65443  ORF Transcript_19375/g.65443 Transcript_19375/m.65443 type:complete len:334 (+) Transcript_19375:82-1083(+)